MPAVSLTDHGSMAGAIDLYKAAAEQGIKPIFGCEVYVVDDRRALTKGHAHLTLLAGRQHRLREPDQALARSATSRATTTSRASTGSCSSASRRG